MSWLINFDYDLLISSLVDMVPRRGKRSIRPTLGMWEMSMVVIIWGKKIDHWEIEGRMVYASAEWRRLWIATSGCGLSYIIGAHSKPVCLSALVTSLGAQDRRSLREGILPNCCVKLEGTVWWPWWLAWVHRVGGPRRFPAELLCLARGQSSVFIV